MTSRFRTLLCLALTTSLGLVLADEPKVNECLECHFADDFKGEAAEAITEMIKASSADDSEHPAKLSGLTEAEIAEIAAYLSRGGDDE